MTPRDRGVLGVVALILLVLAGALAPLAALAQATPNSASKAQLQTMVSIAESSGAYAHGSVAAADFHGLSVVSAHSDLQTGDSSLSIAQTSLASGSNLVEGLAAAQAAMQAYTRASEAATLALGLAGLTAGVDLRATVDGVAELNATATVLGSVTAQACASGAQASSFGQVCTRISEEIANASSSIEEAAALVAQVKANNSEVASLSQANVDLSLARAKLQLATADLLSIASFSYSARAQDYISKILLPMSAKANESIATQNSVLVNATAFENSYASSVGSIDAGTSSIKDGASALATAISGVDLSAVASSISAADSTAVEVQGNLSALNSLVSGLPGTNGLIASTQTAQASTATYRSSIASMATTSSSYPSVGLLVFSAYLQTIDSDRTRVSSASAAYLSDFSNVESELQTFISTCLVCSSILPQLIQLNSTLTALQSSASSTSSEVNSSTNAEANAMAEVQVKLGAYTSIVSASSASIKITPAQLADVSSVSHTEAVYLQGPALSVIVDASAAVQATAQAAMGFDLSANSSLEGAVGSFASNTSSLSQEGDLLSSQAQSSKSSVSAAVAGISMDVSARSAAAASANSEISEALTSFAAQDIDAGVAAMAQATLNFQLASITYAPV